ncbi:MULTISPECIES: DUF6542 domain-containing protein [unclassified Kitasatospora]|uniref:DUF6542 domain-containing protein n=1 Tax=unclassified Kitasatospora TaxID=2633591 RepID=UPI002E105892|nr:MULTISPECIES: DUF6542 domain-containing protein [unclassified Kitasatospora]
MPRASRAEPVRRRRRARSPAWTDRVAAVGGPPPSEQLTDRQSPAVEAESGPRAGHRSRSGRGRVPSALPALGLPVCGALVDELTRSGPGPVFAVCAVLGAALAAALSSRAGWWWVSTSAPVIVLAVASGAQYLEHHDSLHGSALATAAARWVVHAFPVMAAALLAALLVIVLRAALARRRSRRARRAASGRGGSRARRRSAPETTAARVPAQRSRESG